MSKSLRPRREFSRTSGRAQTVGRWLTLSRRRRDSSPRHHLMAEQGVVRRKTAVSTTLAPGSTTNTSKTTLAITG